MVFKGKLVCFLAPVLEAVSPIDKGIFCPSVFLSEHDDSAGG
jgi:hypothetical protein